MGNVSPFPVILSLIQYMHATVSVSPERRRLLSMNRFHSDIQAYAAIFQKSAGF